MDINKLKEKWLVEERESFSGWNFSHLDGRWENEPLNWSYRDIVLSHLNPSDRLLDMGTGGGEFLLSLNHPYALTCATEGYPPNVELCKKTLSPLGIDVRRVDDDKAIPFEDNLFDIIINRHESYDLKEVKRLLKPAGIFITQQVGCMNNQVLAKKLIDDLKPLYSDFTLDNEIDSFTKNGFAVLLSNEQFPALKIFDVGAVVFFAKIIEWEFPDFSVCTHFEKLLALQKELEKIGYIKSIEHRFIIVAKLDANR